MSDLIEINSDNILDIINSNQGIDFPKPYVNDIFLIKVHIAGTSYIQNMDSIVEKLYVGLKVKFFREADNKYDELAILVKDELDNKLGYIPRDKNEILARLMDAGKLIYGEVVKIDEVDGWHKIDMKVMLKDWG